MKTALTICLVAAISFAVASAADSDVVDLTADTFDSHISSNDLTLVEFFAPWCGHCKALVPEYESAATQLKGKHKIAKVDCTEQRDLCGTHNIKGFPTLKLFRKDGTASDYEDARKADAIVKFILKQASPAYTVVNNADELTAFKGQAGSDIKIVLFTSDESSDAAAEFKKASNTLRNDNDFAISIGNSGAAYVTLYRKFDEPEVSFRADIKADELVSWAKAEGLPLVGEIGPENYHKYVERDLPLMWAFVDYANDAQAKIPAALATVAGKFRTKVLVVKLDGQRWGDHAKSFGLTGNLPGLVIEDRKSRKNYVFPENAEITAEAVEAHVQSFLDGKLTASVRSEEPPVDNNGPVTVIVGKTWDSIVLDKTKDVFVEFYAPWCGHCKSLAPKYDALGKEFDQEPTVIVGKIDGTENDTPVEIQGFPTMFLYPAADKANPMPYNGERTTEAMAKFIRDHATTLKGKSGGGKDEL